MPADRRRPAITRRATLALPNVREHFNSDAAHCRGAAISPLSLAGGSHLCVPWVQALVQALRCDASQISFAAPCPCCSLFSSHSHPPRRSPQPARSRRGSPSSQPAGCLPHALTALRPHRCSFHARSSFAAAAVRCSLRSGMVLVDHEVGQRYANAHGAPRHRHRPPTESALAADR